MSRKRSLLVGINYPGTSHALRGCVNDVRTMDWVISKKFGFNVPRERRMLTDASATTQNILERLEWLVDDAQPGDVLYFHYSGHGSQMVDRDYNRVEEPDGKDEIICVAKDNMISTNKGLISAESLYNKIFDGEDVEAKVGNSYHRITLAARTPKEKFIKITTTSNIISNYGVDHPIFVWNDGNVKEVNAQDILPGMKIVKQHEIWDGSSDADDFWTLIGLFVGDGNFYSDDTIRFCVRSYIDYWKDIAGIAKKFSEKVTTTFNSRNDFIITVKSKKITDTLKDMGFIPKKPKKDRIKSKFFIPLEESKSKGFIRGIFDADGTSAKHMVSMISEDYDITKTISILLDCFGIRQQILTDKYNIININNIEANKFVNRIGFGIIAKNEKVCISKITTAGFTGKYVLPSISDFTTKWNIKKEEFTKNCLKLKRGSNTRYETHTFTKQHIYDIKSWLVSICDILEDVIINDGNTSLENRKVIGASMGNVSSILDMNQYTVNNHWKNNNFDEIKQYSELMLDESNKLIQKITDFDMTHYDLIDVSEVKVVNEEDIFYDFTVKDVHRFESDGMLVHNCPIDLNWRDKVIKDDDFKRIFNTVPKGVNLTVVLDCCHSGGGIDNVDDSGDVAYQPPIKMRRDIGVDSPNRSRRLDMPVDIESRAYGMDIDIKPRGLHGKKPDDENDGILISGCQSHQTSADAWIHNRYMGACTYYMTQTIARNNWKISYKKLVEDMNHSIAKYGYTQRPELNGSKAQFNKNFLEPLYK